MNEQSWLRAALSVAFVAMLPLLVIGTNLRWLVTDRDLMLQGFRDNGVAATTRLDDRQLGLVADAFVRYFQAPPGLMEVQVQVDGQPRPLFNDRELRHMQDVQALVQTFLRLQVIAGVVVAARLAWALAVEKSGATLGRDMLLSALFVVGLVVLVGVLALVDFTALWTAFHRVAFRNNLWLLDPRTDYLIMLFPEPAWYTYTIRMVVGVAAMTGLLGVLGALAWRYAPR